MEKFISIAKNIKENYLVCDCCPDQIIGKIIKEGNKLSFAWRDNESEKRINIDDDQEICSSKKIIMVLESPHIEEFIEPYGPAKGKTGENIRLLFEEVCGVEIPLGIYRFVLMNAIQYQCSLGCPTKYFRDKVFRKAWEKFGKNDFKIRLSKLCKEGDVIINACTAGSNSSKHRELVKTVIAQVNSEFRNCVLEYEHPSNWMREKNTATKAHREPNYNWKT